MDVTEMSAATFLILPSQRHGIGISPLLQETTYELAERLKRPHLTFS
jgi:hypothetical protein